MRARKIMKFTKDGKYIKTYNKLIEVTYEGYSASAVYGVANLHNFTHQGYIFIYEDDYSEENIKSRVDRINNKYYMNFRKIGQYELDGTLVREWDSIKKAEREGCFNSRLIWGVLQGHSNHHSGYLWKYLDN